MFVEELSNGNKHPVDILPLDKLDWQRITKAKYFFDWKQEQRYSVFKLVKKHQTDILGLMSLEILIEEWRVHIRLIAVSKSNKGNGKIYDRVVGNLMAFAAILSIKEFGELACVSLKPKSRLVEHYKTAYFMRQTGMLLSIEVPEIFKLVTAYDN